MRVRLIEDNSQKIHYLRVSDRWMDIKSDDERITFSVYEKFESTVSQLVGTRRILYRSVAWKDLPEPYCFINGCDIKEVLMFASYLACYDVYTRYVPVIAKTLEDTGTPVGIMDTVNDTRIIMHTEKYFKDEEQMSNYLRTYKD